MTDDEAKLAGLRRVLADDELFCGQFLKVKDKSGNIRPFVWNRAQHFIHEKLEAQRGELGIVRALVLKGRQQGCSTYVGARFYKRTSTVPGKSAFIVAHEDKATSNLFDMVKRYQKHNPLAPSIQASNAKELVFGALDSGYKLATAGTDDVGRSNTSQLLHGSEFGFWRNAQTHMAGIGNTVSDELHNGTEIILESTANGIGNAFHAMWQDAEAGKGLYQAIFVPWFWQTEYASPPRKDLVLSPEDELYMRAYGLSLPQMQWRADKIASYGDGFAYLFDQEYPATAALAFQSPTKNPLISPNSVMMAVNSKFRDANAPLVIGVDPAGDGDGTPDRTCIVFRRGRMVPRVEYHEKLNTMQIAGMLADYWHNENPDGIIIDKGGLGAGIYDRLVELNIPVIGIMYGQQANDPDLYENLKAEIYYKVRDWFADQPCRIPNNAAFISDITAPQPDVSSNGRKAVESKAKLTKRGIRSPDGLDALANTFAVKIQHRVAPGAARGPKQAPTTAGY